MVCVCVCVCVYVCVRGDYPASAPGRGERQRQTERQAVCPPESVVLKDSGLPGLHGSALMLITTHAKHSLNTSPDVARPSKTSPDVARPSKTSPDVARSSNTSPDVARPLNMATRLALRGTDLGSSLLRELRRGAFKFIRQLGTPCPVGKLSLGHFDVCMEHTEGEK